MAYIIVDMTRRAHLLLAIGVVLVIAFIYSKGGTEVEQLSDDIITVQLGSNRIQDINTQVTIFSIFYFSYYIELHWRSIKRPHDTIHPP